MAVHVMLVALSVEDTGTLKVDLRILSTIVAISSIIIIPLACQIMLLATAVQLNSATPLIETLSARGGIVISEIILYIKLTLKVY